MRAEPAVGAGHIDDATAAELLPTREARSHKGTHGTLVVVAGSLDYLGAALLAGRAATRAGAGLVVLAVPRSLQPIAAGHVPELVTLGLPDAAGDIDPSAAVAAIAGRRHAALLVGPGLRSSDATADLVLRLVRGEGSEPGEAEGASATGDAPPPAVLDAEALNVLAAAGQWWERAARPLVLTPHPGEFGRLDGAAVGGEDDERRARATEAATRWGQTVVLKGARTVIAAPDGRVAVAPFEVPALATAGTGDVLAGTIAALLCQGMVPYEAAVVGVYLHGLAGARLAERFGDAGLVASDLPLEVALARNRLAEVRDRARRGGRLGFGSREPRGA